MSSAVFFIYQELKLNFFAKVFYASKTFYAEAL
jgi:hypothetical protein